MSPPIYTPDGNEVTKIVLPDGSTASEVVAPDGSVVFDAGPEIPDSVVYQYVAGNFASPWPDEIQSADMAVNGMVGDTFSNSEPSVFGDGTDDYGLASGPESLPTNETFGIAFTVEYPSQTDFQHFAGTETATSHFKIELSDDGTGPRLNLSDDNSNRLIVRADSDFSGGVRTVIINKFGNLPSDIDIYVDDITNPTSTTTVLDEGFDHAAYSNSLDMAFWARNNEGSRDLYLEADMGVFEFNSDPYSQSEREDFVSRRPEV